MGSTPIGPRLQALLALIFIPSLGISFALQALYLQPRSPGALRCKRPVGEIGRHAILRGWCSQGRAGSNPVLGTRPGSRRLLGLSFFSEGQAEGLSLRGKKKGHFLAARGSRALGKTAPQVRRVRR